MATKIERRDSSACGRGVMNRHAESFFTLIKANRTICTWGQYTHPFDGEVSGAVVCILGIDVLAELIKFSERCPGHSTGKLHDRIFV